MWADAHGLAELDWIEPSQCPYLPSANESIEQIHLNLRNGKKMEVEDLMNYILSFLENISKEEGKVAEELRIKELEQQDLLHELEISKLNAPEMMITTKQLIQVRKERRELKNDLQRIVILRRFADRQKSRNLDNEIRTLQKELKKTNDYQQYGKYKPRVLKNLKIGENK